jgi:UDP-N-acetylmuramoyl-tripeptide--D-alanyl-D-alanine ligase
MSVWDPARVAAAAGAELLSPGQGEGHAPADHPPRAGVDSRSAGPGELFVGLPGERADGGLFAEAALRARAWGVLVEPAHAQRGLAALRAGPAGAPGAHGAVLAHPDPLRGLQDLARAWRGELGAAGARVVAITGSSGKTSTKDILGALLAAHGPTAATPANLNTEIGLPLAILGAPPGTAFLVLEMAMRGPGQIAELTAIAEPDVGVIVNVGPAHLELLGSLEAIAAAKAELVAGLQLGATAVVPAGEPLLEPHLRGDLATTTFGEGGDVSLLSAQDDGGVAISARGEEIELRPSFAQPHQLRNLLAAVAAARALGVTPHGPLQVEFSAGRGGRVDLGDDVLLIDDCYNANPMSMRAAIDDLADTAPGRRVAVLGDMLELGPQAPALHAEIGRHAADRGVDLLVAVGPLAREIAGSFAGESVTADDARAAAELVPGLVRDGDTVLVKASRGIGLEAVALALAEARGGRALLAGGAGHGRS